MPNSTNRNEYQTFQFATPRQKRIYRRLELLGPGPAAFYRDACYLMSLQPKLATTTHLVGHLLREIESSMRDVLLSAAGEKVVDQEKKHKVEVIAVLRFLEVPESHEVATLWLGVTGATSFHSKAHRDDLLYRPSGDWFANVWENIQTVFDVVLLRFEEKYLDAHRIIEELIAVKDPENHVSTLRKNAPNNRIALSIFFERADIAWLKHLKDEYFKLPPEVDPIDGRPLRWPESRFLRRAAGTEPEIVKAIVKRWSPVTNPHVLDDICAIVNFMPIDYALELLPTLKSWLNANKSHMALEVADLIVRLAEGGKSSEALDLTACYLAIAPDVERGFRSYNGLRSRFTPFWYHDVLQRWILNAARHNALGFIAVLTSLLENAATLSEREGIDITGFWSLKLLRHGEPPIENALIVALLDLIEVALKQDQFNLEKVIDLLESKPAILFRRIALYVLARHPAVIPTLTSKQLLEREAFENCETEYFLLLQNGFCALSSMEKNVVLGYLNELDEPAKLYLLDGVSTCLEGDWFSYLLQLKANYGDPSAYVYCSPIEVETWWGGGSPLSEQELKELNPNELLDYLKAWKPQDNRSRLSEHGLGAQLQRLVSSFPNELAGSAENFEDVPLVYVGYLLSGFRDACTDELVFAWEPVLRLCHNLVVKASNDVSRLGDETSVEMLSQMADLCISGFEYDSLDYRHRESVWSIVSALWECSISVHQHKHIASAEISSFGSLFSTLRGRSLRSVIQYIAWVQRHVTGNAQSIFYLTPEAKTIIEQEVCADSVTTKAVFGRYVPKLHALDEEWLSSHLSCVFAEDEKNWMSAWSAYNILNRPYKQVYRLLKNEYTRAVDRFIGRGVERSARKADDVEESLISHMVQLYLHGEIVLGDEDSLLQHFYRLAADTDCACVMECIGRGFRNSEESIEDIILSRFYALVEQRLIEIRKNPQAHLREIQSCTEWFVSGKLPNHWVIEKFKELTALTPGTRLSLIDMVIGQLAQVALELPGEAIECLSLALEHDREPWEIEISRADIRTVLTLALNCPDNVRQEMAKALINRLASRGDLSFADLLPASTS